MSELRSARSFLELKMSLKVNHPAISQRYTHIIATIGMGLHHDGVCLSHVCGRSQDAVGGEAGRADERWRRHRPHELLARLARGDIYCHA